MLGRTRRFLGVAALAAVALGAVPASAASADSCRLPRFGPGRSYHPHIRPRDFSPHVDNRWFPLTPGRTLVYTGTKDGRKASTSSRPPPGPG